MHTYIVSEPSNCRCHGRRSKHLKEAKEWKIVLYTTMCVCLMFALLVRSSADVSNNLEGLATHFLTREVTLVRKKIRSFTADDLHTAQKGQKSSSCLRKHPIRFKKDTKLLLNYCKSVCVA